MVHFFVQKTFLVEKTTSELSLRIRLYLDQKISSLLTKGQRNSKWFFQDNFSSKKQTSKFNFTSMIPQLNLFSFVFWRKLKTPKIYVKINWSLELSQRGTTFSDMDWLVLAFLKIKYRYNIISMMQGRRKVWKSGCASIN